MVRGTAEQVLSRSGAAAWMRARRVSDTLVLAYHNIVPEGESAAGDRSLHLAQRVFAKQLDILARTHEVVPLTAALNGGGRRRPRAVITFDDACGGAVTAGVDELVRRGLPATVFVSPAFVGGRSFWWDALEESADARGGGETKARALELAQGKDDRVRVLAEKAGIRLRDVPWHQRCATEDQLHAVPAELVTFGSHSWSHPNLATLGGPELKDELIRPLMWLRERFPNAIPWLAYPYGITSPAVSAAARASGYAHGLRITGGWLRRGSDESYDGFDLPRLNIPAGVSLRGFELRISGVVK